MLGQILSWKCQCGCHSSSAALKTSIVQMRDMLDKLVLLGSKILIYIS